MVPMEDENTPLEMGGTESHHPMLSYHSSGMNGGL